MTTKRTIQIATLAFFFATTFAATLDAGEQGDDNPTGVAGAFNGSITTAGNYDPYTGNMHRQIDDIIIPGSVGAYPLKWTRYFNSHVTYSQTSLNGSGTGGAWRFSYIGYNFNGTLVRTPDGRIIEGGGDGVPEFVDINGLHLADGGRVTANAANRQIIDPYGQTTTVVTTGSGISRTTKITEPGGRYLLVSYNYFPDPSDPNHFKDEKVSKVEAFDGVSQQPMQTVAYTWTKFSLGGIPVFWPVITDVSYSDGTSAHYEYTDQSYPGPPCDSSNEPWHAALLSTADDVRYAGPMRQIAYRYYTSGNKTRVLGENHFVNGAAGEAVSSISGVASSNPTISATETRGDGDRKRTFSYDTYPVVSNCTGQEPKDLKRPSQGKLLSYTDFYSSGGTPHTTTIGYEGTDPDTDPHWGFINQVKDARQNITTYERQANSWGIKKITHPDGNTIQQTFWPAHGYNAEGAPWYLASRTDENGHTTTYHRDDPANPNAITQKDYADGTSETFAYNNFGQVLTHKMRSGAYQHFSYDSRGLLLAKTNPTWTADHDAALASDPKTTYTYYTASDHGGAWTDRVKRETDPRGLVTEFEYDHTFPNNGTETTTPAASRGLVTKITHVSDNTAQSFTYNRYGDKLTVTDELNHTTRYEYDDYGRVVKVTNPLQKFITNDYRPSNNTSLSPYVHTTSSVYTTTTPTGIVSQNIYDENFRKISTTAGFGTGQAATTWFQYDNVGNPTKVTDPRGSGSGDPAYTTTTDYDTRNRKWHVTDPLGHMATFDYDYASNNTTITRSDGTVETKTYNEVNQVLTDRVPKSGTPANVTEYVTTTFEYYPSSMQMAGQLWHVSQLLGESETGPRRTTEFQYDASGKKTRMAYPLNDAGGTNPNEYQSWTYDTDHNLIARRTVNGVSQLFSYDSRNRQISMAWSNGLDWATFGYDDAGRMTSAQNPTSIVTRSYDDAGRMTLDRQRLQILPIRAVSRKIHGSVGTFDVGLPLSGTAGVECRMGQGTNNDQHQMIAIFPRAVSFTSASVTTGTATVSSTSQSADNTQVTVNLTGMSNAQTVIVTLSGVNDGSVTNDVNVGIAVLAGDTNGDGFVDSADIAQTASQSGHAVTTSNFREDLQLDGFVDSADKSLVQTQSGATLGNTPSLSQPVPSSPNIDVQYAYDDDGKNTRMYATSSAGTAGYDLTYGYSDGQGRFKTISQTGGAQLFEYGYDKASNETSRTGPNTLNQVYGRDSLNRMTSRTINQGSSAVSVEVYGYDASRPGLMTSVTHQEGTSPATHDQFGYDLLPELESADYNLQGAAPDAAAALVDQLLVGGVPGFNPPTPPSRSVDYTWDRAGNRKSLTDSLGQSYNYLTTSLNQYSTDGLTNITNGSEHELMSYQNINYTYVNDSHVCLVAGTDIFGQQSRYEMYYDALGRRVVTVLNGSTTYYIYDGEKSILEYRGWSGGPSAANVYGKGIDEILKRTDYIANSTIYYQDDHEGSITHLTDSSGNVIEYYRYDAFGKPTIYNPSGLAIQTSAFENRFMFTGREYVAKFGIYEYRARAYHPGLGRFMSEDRKGANGSNLFAYCGNTPLTAVDPMGEWYEQVTKGGVYVWNVPISFYGNGANRQNISAALNILNSKWHGSFSGYVDGKHTTYSVRMNAYQARLPNTFNHIELKNSFGKNGFGTTDSKGGGHWNVQGGNFFGTPVSFEQGVFHEGGHVLGLGFPEKYDNTTGKAKSGYEDSIMGGPNGKVTFSDVAEVVKNGQSGALHNLRGMIGRLGSGAFAGMQYAGHGYYTNGSGTFTNQAEQVKAGNYGSWNANHYGASHSDPFGDDAEGSQVGAIHPVPRWLY